MRPVPPPTRLLLAACLSLAACGTRPRSGLLADASAPQGTCQHTCTPDPGSRALSATECGAATAGLELAPLADFEGERATGLYSYTDSTTKIASFQLPMVRTYEPNTASAPRCGAATNRAIHVQGGPFLAWGGGIGMAMLRWPLKGECFTSRADYCISDNQTFAEFPTMGQYIADLSKWEGISFWARRGPDSQIGFRVVVGDKYTDDDINFQTQLNNPTGPLYCKRAKECGCRNHMPCEALTAETIASARMSAPAACMVDVGREFCGAPALEGSAGVPEGAGFLQCNTCNVTRCNDPYPAFQEVRDPQFAGKPCTPFTYRNGVAVSLCYDPAKEAPAQPDEQCGDHWTKTVALSNDWQFFTVPFSSMLQQGFGKKQNALDLSAISLVRFTWDGGWVDYWIDDVAFYRRKK